MTNLPSVKNIAFDLRNVSTGAYLGTESPILEQDDPRIIAIRRLLGFKTKEFRQINI